MGPGLGDRACTRWALVPSSALPRTPELVSLPCTVGTGLAPCPHLATTSWFQALLGLGTRRMKVTQEGVPGVWGAAEPTPTANPARVQGVVSTEIRCLCR